MRPMGGFVVLMITMLASLPIAAQQPGGQRGGGAAAPAMTLTVAGFPDGGDVPVKFTQAAPGVSTGEGLSPAINWANPPAGTQSFFLNMHDEDVARNKTTDGSGALGGVEPSRDGDRAPRRRAQGAETRQRRLPNQRNRPDVPRAGCRRERSQTSLHVRDLRARHDDRCATIRRRVRNTSQCDEGDPGTRARQSGLRRALQTAAISASATLYRCSLKT